MFVVKKCLSSCQTSGAMDFQININFKQYMKRQTWSHEFFGIILHGWCKCKALFRNEKSKKLAQSTDQYQSKITHYYAGQNPVDTVPLIFCVVYN